MVLCQYDVCGALMFQVQQEVRCWIERSSSFLRICHCDGLKLFYKKWPLRIRMTNAQTGVTRRETWSVGSAATVTLHLLGGPRHAFYVVTYSVDLALFPLRLAQMGCTGAGDVTRSVKAFSFFSFYLCGTPQLHCHRKLQLALLRGRRMLPRIVCHR